MRRPCASVVTTDLPQGHFIHVDPQIEELSMIEPERGGIRDGNVSEAHRGVPYDKAEGRVEISATVSETVAEAPSERDELLKERFSISHSTLQVEHVPTPPNVRRTLEGAETNRY